MRLIEDLLNVTRIESDNLMLRPSEFVLDDLIAEVASEVQRISPQHRIEFELETPVTITADRDRIEQVMMNLLTNATKYSPKSDLVRISTSLGADEVVVSVQDFGPGIPEEKQPHIFERFYRIDGSDSPGSPGLGLGLFISSEFVKRHGGRIWVESDEGVGTTVSFSLPRDGRYSHVESLHASPETTS